VTDCLEAAGCVHNAVPVIYHQGSPLDAVVPKLMVDLVACRDRFDTLAARIEKRAAHEKPNVRQDLRTYIDGLRTIATGTMEFTCVSRQTYTCEHSTDGSYAEKSPPDTGSSRTLTRMAPWILYFDQHAAGGEGSQEGITHLAVAELDMMLRQVRQRTSIAPHQTIPAPLAS
jgi:hypothetical protein